MKVFTDKELRDAYNFGWSTQAKAAPSTPDVVHLAGLRAIEALVAEEGRKS